MARLIPEDALQMPSTEGEGRLLRALDSGLDDSCVVWFQPYLANRREADILVYVPKLGLIIYEVKDWSATAIEDRAGNQWIVRHGGKKTREKPPHLQVRGYFHVLAKLLEQEPMLCHSSPEHPHRGKIKLPVATAVAFPRITRGQFERRQLNKELRPNVVLCSDEIDDIAQEANRATVLERLRQHFDPPPFSNDPLTSEELGRLIEIITPQIPPLSPAERNKAIRKEKADSERRVQREQESRRQEAEARERAERELALAKTEVQRLTGELRDIQAQLASVAADANSASDQRSTLEAQIKELQAKLLEAEAQVASATREQHNSTSPPRSSPASGSQPIKAMFLSTWPLERLA